MASIRITSTPPGEAPVAIRAAWVGLELPLARTRAGRYIGSGVLSGPRNIIKALIHLLTFRFGIHEGFVVPTLPAIEVLERANPGAARWWRENARTWCARAATLSFQMSAASAWNEDGPAR